MHKAEGAVMTDYGVENAREAGARLLRARVRIENVNRTVLDIAAELSAASSTDKGYAAQLRNAANDLARLAAQVEAERLSLQNRMQESCERNGIPPLMADEDILYRPNGSGSKAPLTSLLAQQDEDWDVPDTYEP